VQGPLRHLITTCYFDSELFGFFSDLFRFKFCSLGVKEPAEANKPSYRWADRRRSRPAANPGRPHPAGGSDKGVASNIVNFERAGIDVAQHEVGRAGCADRSNACETPIQSDRADEGSAGELIVVDVVELQPAGLAVAQQQIGFAGHAAEIADTRELPIEPDRADEGSAGDLVVADAESKLVKAPPL
jgi:hypothetical protein